VFRLNYPLRLISIQQGQVCAMGFIRGDTLFIIGKNSQTFLGMTTYIQVFYG